MKLDGLRCFLKNLLFPPRCISCRSFLQSNILDPCESLLCPKCRLRWEREKGEACPDCGFEISVCECCPPRLKKEGVGELIYLFSYSSSKQTVGRQTILNMKKKANAKAGWFMAEQLSHSVERYMSAHSLSAEQVGFCYVPRGRTNLAKYGFDQSQMLCRALAERSGAAWYSLCIRCRGKDAEQKKLSAREREQNAEDRFSVDRKQLSRLSDQASCLFFVDDIVTSGESMRGCVKAVRQHFLGDMVAVSIARTSKKQSK